MHVVHAGTSWLDQTYSRTKLQLLIRQTWCRLVVLSSETTWLDSQFPAPTEVDWCTSWRVHSTCRVRVCVHVRNSRARVSCVKMCMCVSVNKCKQTFQVRKGHLLSGIIPAVTLTWNIFRLKQEEILEKNCSLVFFSAYSLSLILYIGIYHPDVYTSLYL